MPCTGWAVRSCAPGASSTPAATPGLPAHLSMPRPIPESLTAEPFSASQSRASALRSWESSGFLQLQVGPHPQGHVTEERGQEDGLDGAFRGTLLPLAPAPEMGSQVWSETSTRPELHLHLRTPRKHLGFSANARFYVWGWKWNASLWENWKPFFFETHSYFLAILKGVFCSFCVGVLTYDLIQITFLRLGITTPLFTSKKQA